MDMALIGTEIVAVIRQSLTLFQHEPLSYLVVFAFIVAMLRFVRGFVQG